MRRAARNSEDAHDAAREMSRRIVWSSMIVDRRVDRGRADLRGLALAQLILAFSIASAGIHSDRRMLAGAGVVLAGFPFVLLAPSWAFEINAASIGGLGAVFAWLWRRATRAASRG